MIPINISLRFPKYYVEICKLSGHSTDPSHTKVSYTLVQCIPSSQPIPLFVGFRSDLCPTIPLWLVLRAGEG